MLPEALQNESIVKYAPGGPDQIDDGVYLTHWKSDGEPASPPATKEPYHLSSTDQIHGASCQEHSDSLQTADLQQAHWSSLDTSSESRYDYNHAVTYNSTSQYPFHGWSPSHGYTTQYTSSSKPSYTYLPLSRTHDGERLRSSYQGFWTREISDGSGIETRHSGESRSIWLPTNSQNSQNDVHQNVGPLNESGTFEVPQPGLAYASQSTAQIPYTNFQPTCRVWDPPYK